MEHYTLYRPVTRNIRHEVSTWRRLWDVKQPWTCRNKCFVSTWPRKKKHAPTIWTHIDGNQKGIPQCHPIHPRTKIWPFEGITNKPWSLDTALLNWAERWYSLWSTKKCQDSVHSFPSWIVQWSRFWRGWWNPHGNCNASIGCLFMSVNCWPCFIFYYSRSSTKMSIQVDLKNTVPSFTFNNRLPEINSSHLNMDDWKISFLWGPAPWQVQTVSFRET